MRINRDTVLLFLTVLAVTLAITFPLFQTVRDFGSLPIRYVVINSVLAILIAVGAALAVVIIGHVLLTASRKLWHPLLAKISLFAIAKATAGHASETNAIGIGDQGGILVIRLATRSTDSVSLGDHYIARNAATRQELGVLEVVEVDQSSLLCSIFDRMDSVEFWQDLEFRMVRDPSPPAGTTFVRQVDQPAIEYVIRMLADWGG